MLLETIEVLQAQGIDCRVILPARGPFSQRLMKLGIPFRVVTYPMWMSRGKIGFLARLRTVLNLLKDTLEVAWRTFQWKCDVVCSNTATVCVGAFASRLLGRPHVWYLHEFGIEDQGLTFLFGDRLSLGLIDRLSNRCICVSHALAKKYANSIDPSKLRVIYPSMHTALRGAGAEDDKLSVLLPYRGRFRCVMVGALIEGKGQRDAVLALAYLKKSGIAVELVIVGRGEEQYRCELEELVRTQDLENEIVFVQQVENSLPVMQSSDVVLVCSKSEAFGRVTVEGMFSGRPVIGARSGATSELIKDGINGLLYRQGDPSDLASKIDYLRKNPRIADELGKNGRSWVKQHFTEERYAAEIIAVLNSLSLPLPKALGAAPAA